MKENRVGFSFGYLPTKSRLRSDARFNGRGRIDVLDLRVGQSEDAFDVMAVPCVEHPAHDLHVLLRHRLLRQPGGFEGFRPCGVVAHAHRLAVPEPVKADIGLIDYEVLSPRPV